MTQTTNKTRWLVLPMLLACSFSFAEPLPTLDKHHWGQKGQSKPNNGWSNYGMLELDMGGPDRIALYQNKSELLAKIIDKETNEEKAGAFSMLGAGLFYRPKSIDTCEPDTIERVGIYAELALNFVANAYPSGPEKTLPLETKTVKGPSTNVRFMQASIDNKKPWSVSVEVKQSAQGEHTFEITDLINPKTDKITMHWMSNQGHEIPVSNAKIADWQACWLGMQASTKQIRIPDTDKISTFGELRTRLKQTNDKASKK